MTYPYRSVWAPPACNFALKHATKPCHSVLKCCSIYLCCISYFWKDMLSCSFLRYVEISFITLHAFLLFCTIISKTVKKIKENRTVLWTKINLVYKNFTRCLSNIQNMSLHNYVVTDMKKVSTKNFQLFPHSFPQQNIDNVLFFSVFNMPF